MKVAIVNTHLRLGGIRQSLLNLLDALKSQDIEIDLYILSGELTDVQKQIDGLPVQSVMILPEMDIYYRTFREQSSIGAKWKKILFAFCSRVVGRETLVKKIVAHEKLPEREYDVVISYANGIWSNGSRHFSGGCEFVAQRLKGRKKIAWIHSNPRNLGFTKEIGERIYSNFDKIVNVSYGCKSIFDEICPNLMDKSIVIYNLCNSEKVHQLMNETIPYKGGFNIVTVARLDNKSKRLDHLAKCCKILKDSGYVFQWHVVGDGNDMSLLKTLRNSYQLQDELVIEGRKQNPYPYMKNADLYVCTSAYEAFSMVLKESFLCGTPAITTPIPPAKEVIRDGKNGFICKGFEPEDIVEQVKIVMDNKEILPALRKKIGEDSKIYEDNVQPFLMLCGVESKL